MGQIRSGKGAPGALRGAVLVLAAMSLGLVTAGCSSFQNKKPAEFTFDGIDFKAKAKKVSKEDRSRFQVEVRKATQSLDGAKEAGRYEATKYCIEEYGTSNIDWVSGPDQENNTLTVIDGDLLMEGICKI